MPSKLSISTPHSEDIGDDPVDIATGRRTSQLRPKSWINYQKERQRSQELKRAREEEDKRQHAGKLVKSETPMIEWTSAFFRKLFRRPDRADSS